MRQGHSLGRRVASRPRTHFLQRVRHRWGLRGQSQRRGRAAHQVSPQCAALTVTVRRGANGLCERGLVAAFRVTQLLQQLLGRRGAVRHVAQAVLHACAYNDTRREAQQAAHGTRHHHSTQPTISSSTCFLRAVSFAVAWSLPDSGAAPCPRVDTEGTPGGATAPEPLPPPPRCEPGVGGGGGAARVGWRGGAGLPAWLGLPAPLEPRSCSCWRNRALSAAMRRASAASSTASEHSSSALPERAAASARTSSVSLPASRLDMEPAVREPPRAPGDGWYDDAMDAEEAVRPRNERELPPAPPPEERGVPAPRCAGDARCLLGVSARHHTARGENAHPPIAHHMQRHALLPRRLRDFPLALLGVLLPAPRLPLRLLGMVLPVLRRLGRMMEAMLWITSSVPVFVLPLYCRPTLQQAPHVHIRTATHARGGGGECGFVNSRCTRSHAEPQHAA